MLLIKAANQGAQQGLPRTLLLVLLNQWSPGERSSRSPLAYDTLASMLNLIEGGCERRAHLKKAKAACLAKDPTDPQSPHAHRILLMLPAVYRLWSMTRLRHH